MISDLTKLQREWEFNENSPDLADRGEWVKGILYGVKLAIRVVQKYADPRNIQRVVADLDALQKNWEGKPKSPEFMNKTQWLGGVVYGINQASHLVIQHLSAPPSMRGQSNTPY